MAEQPAAGEDPDSVAPNTPEIHVGNDFYEIPPHKGDSKWYARGGHFYVVCRCRPPSILVRCASDRCPVRWKFRNGKAGPVIGDHNHEPTPWVPNRNAMFQAIKRRCIDEDIPLLAIYKQEARRYPDAAPHLLYERVAPSMRKWRRMAAELPIQRKDKTKKKRTRIKKDKAKNTKTASQSSIVSENSNNKRRIKEDKDIKPQIDSQSEINSNEDSKNYEYLPSSNTLLNSSLKDTEGITEDEDNFEAEYLEDTVEDDFLPEEGDRADVSSSGFTWHQASAVVPRDADNAADAECSTDAVMFEVSPLDRARHVESVHEGFRCNCCSGSIVGFRYVCVQCADYDLCGACEAGGAHSEHYVLRVPGPRPHNEVAGVLHTIRRALVADSIVLVEGMQGKAKKQRYQSDPISLDSQAESDGEDREMDSDESAGDNMLSPTLENDDSSSFTSSGDDADDSQEDLKRLKGSRKRNINVHTATTVSHAQVRCKSSSTRQNVKRTKSAPIRYFDRRTNVIVVLGGENTEGTQPASLKRNLEKQLQDLPSIVDKILTDKRNSLTDKRITPKKQALLDSKRARVNLERLHETELHTALHKR